MTRPGLTPHLIQMRMRSDHLIEAGDIMLSTTGRCWRVETARPVNTRTPHPECRRVYQLGVTRFPADEVARCLNLGGPPGPHRLRIGDRVHMINLNGPWWVVDMPGGRVEVHPFVRHRQPPLAP